MPSAYAECKGGLMKHRVLLISDMHYTCEKNSAQMKQIDPTVHVSVAAGDAFGHTQREKIDLLRKAILDEHERAPLDGVLVLGDLSIDDYDYRNLPVNYCRRFREEVMDDLPCPSWALAGNHDSYPDEIWQEIFGYGRQFTAEIGGMVFAMADTFSQTPAQGASGSPYTPLDVAFLEQVAECHPNQPLFLCAHHIGLGGESDEARTWVKNHAVCMFRGHTHHDGIGATDENWGNKPLIDIGGYAYNGIRTPEGKWVFSCFDFAWAWGYQMLEWEDGGREALTYHVKPAYRYVAENGVFETRRTVSSVIELPLSS